MKKPPPHKHVKPKPNLQQLTVSTNQKKPKPATRVGAKVSGRIEPAKLSVASVWKDFWSFAGPVITVAGIIASVWPSISISTGVNLDPSQDLQTQFVVTNAGKIPVNNIKFACSLVGTSMDAEGLSMNTSTLLPITQLNAGEPASRGCFTESLKIDGPMLKVQAYYEWPLIGREASTVAYFSVRRGASGNFLVPEAPPSPEPRTLLIMGYRPQ